MAHLIDKDAVVAEIEKEIKSIYAGREYVGIPIDEENIVRGLVKAEEIINGTIETKEVDLDKFIEKINTFQGRYKYPEITSIKGAMAFMARMFYSYPNVAREWYESLPKATMD